jgi:hypothetical protein
LAFVNRGQLAAALPGCLKSNLGNTSNLGSSIDLGVDPNFLFAFLRNATWLAEVNATG